MSERLSIQPTYDQKETGPRFTVETRINGKRLDLRPMPDPFMNHRVVIGWRDLWRFVRQGRSIEVLVGGDSEIVEDVLELDSDWLGLQNSSRRREWNEEVERKLVEMVDSAAVAEEGR